ncbi:MAG: amino acid racemase [candidate division WOR-3 bacterium]|nr:MAG: amino acid racemase [candidate division WOR-3 bacterium]
MKIVGVIGGMGPKATTDFMNKVIALTPAKKDQEHVKMIVYIDPEIPDRTEAIMGKGESPQQKLVGAAKFLEDAGVDFIVMPCVTAHVWFRDMQSSITAQILNIVELTLEKVKKDFKKAKRIGILSTTGTMQSQLFEKVFEPEGYTIIVPQGEVQKNYVMKGIDEIKFGRDPDKVTPHFVHAHDDLVSQGVDIIILACTDIPLSLKQADAGVPLIDVNKVLAEATVRLAFD